MGDPLVTGVTAQAGVARVARRARPVVAMAVAGGILAAGLSTPATAQSDGSLSGRQREIGQSLARLRTDLAETSQQMLAAATLLQRAQSRLPAARSALAQAQGDLAAAQARDAQAAANLAAAQAAERKAERAVAAAEQRIAERKALVAAVARNAYTTGGYAELAVVLEAASAADLAGRLSSVEGVLRAQNGVLTRLADDRANLASSEGRLAARRADSAAARTAARDRLVATRAAEERARAAATALADLVAARKRALDLLAAERRNEERRIASLEAQGQAIQAELRRRAAAARAARLRAAAIARASRLARSSAPFAAGRYDVDRLSRPIPGSVITSSYGMRRHPIFQVMRMHNGTDFGAGCGTAIRAAADGVVIWAEARGGYGYQTTIDHGVMRGRNIVTSYSHQLAGGFTARAGELVRRGDVIGRVGSTGFSTGCHLHFMAYVEGRPVNPVALF